MTTANPLQRFDMTTDDIDRLMSAFYARVRRHEVLGPIFLNAVGEGGEEWEEHEAKIASFWRNALLMDRDYSGNPMMVHMMNPDIEVGHFPIWLELFRSVAFQVLDSAKASNIADLADRIGRGLSFGIANARQSSSEPPVLT